MKFAADAAPETAIRQPHRTGLPQIILLFTILLAAALLRVFHVGLPALSVDELGSIETAAGRGQVHLFIPRDVLLTSPPEASRFDGAAPIWQVPRRMREDVHPPLYFVALRAWQDIFGGGDVASRMLSVIAGVIGVLLIFDVGRWLSDTTTGLWAAGLMALAQPEIIYSQDARPYALAAMFALAAASLLARMQRLGITRRRLLSFGAALTAASLTHYFVLPAIVAMGIYAIAAFPAKDRRKILLSFAASGAAVMILWGWGMWLQKPNFSDPWMYWFNDNIPDHVLMTWKRFAALPLRYLAEPQRDSVAVGSGAAVLYLLPFILCRRKPALILPACWLVGCAGLVLALDLARTTNQLTLIKYTLLAAPAVYLILPMLLNHWLLKHALPATAIIYCALALPQAYEPTKADFKTLAARLDQSANADDPVLFAGAGWGDWYTGGLYMAVERYARPLPRSVALLTKPVSGDLLTQLQGHRCWLVMSYTSLPPETFAPQWHARKVDSMLNAWSLYELTWRDR